MKKAIIVGAGIAGLALSIRLARKGYSVQVFEANSSPGGKLSVDKFEGYRFDTGPSLFTMPHFVDELFIDSNENPRDFFNYKRKSIHCNYFWDDKKSIKAYDDRSKYLEEIKKNFNVDPKVLNSYLENAKKKYNLIKSTFLESSLNKVETYLNKKTLKALFQLRIFEINKTLNSVNQKQLQEPHLVQLYNRYATYNGSNPFETPGIMTLVQHLEEHYGTFIPDKGMKDIANSLYKLAKRQGVEFYFNSYVNKINILNNKATGVIVDSREFFADKVISNMDIYFTYKKLLKDQIMPKKLKSAEPSSSAVIFYWGIKKQFKQLDLHNIFFSNDYKAEFEFIFNRKQIFSDPTVYINISSKDIKGDAPAGCENWFVMINAPADNGQDWDKIIKDLKKAIIKKIDKNLNTNLNELIQVEHIVTPPMIEKSSFSRNGALYGTSSNSKFSAFLRHSNFSKKIKNLYFCGGSVHPGGGIPLCLLSAKIVSKEILSLN